MKLKLQIYPAITALAVMLAGATRATADAVLDWNLIAVQTIQAAVPPRPGPTVPFLDLAIVQAAVYDAVQAIDGRFEAYYARIPGASGSPEAAAAKAAHDVLVNIFPGQTAALDMAYHDYFTAHGLAEDDPGVAVGQVTAASILALRANDGRVPSPLPPPFIGGTAPGEWRPTPSFQAGPPPSLSPMATPWLGAVPPFTLNSGDQFRAKPPPPLNSKRYAQDYNEVKALGSLVGSARTPEQTALANFYPGNTIITFQQTLREIAGAHLDNIGDRARLLALVDLAVADAVITAWDGKLHFHFWRPLTAIQEGNNDGNAATDGDPAWQPFLNTPPYPEYTSGFNNVVGALTRMLALFFGTDHMTFTVTTTNPVPDPTRTYHRFSDLAVDAVNVRIYHGIHFRFADTAARKQSGQVAEWAFRHFLRRLCVDDRDHPNNHDDDDDDDHDDDHHQKDRHQKDRHDKD